MTAGSALSTPTAESLRRLHRKLDCQCARAAEALAAMRDEGAALTRRGPNFSVGHLRLGAAAAAIVLACAHVVAANDLLGNAQTWRWAGGEPTPGEYLSTLPMENVP